jgi:hypothetical protein
MKNHVRFIRYGIEVVRAKLRDERLPLPLAATSDTSYPRAGINQPQPGHPVHRHVLGFDGSPAALNRFRPRAACPSTQTRPISLAPPARRGYDARARRARLISDLDSGTALQFELSRGVYQGGRRSRLASASANRKGAVLTSGPVPLIGRTRTKPLRC